MTYSRIPLGTIKNPGRMLRTRLDGASCALTYGWSLSNRASPMTLSQALSKFYGPSRLSTAASGPNRQVISTYARPSLLRLMEISCGDLWKSPVVAKVSPNPKILLRLDMGINTCCLTPRSRSGRVLTSARTTFTWRISGAPPRAQGFVKTVQDPVDGHNVVQSTKLAQLIEWATCPHPPNSCQKRVRCVLGHIDPNGALEFRSQL